VLLSFLIFPNDADFFFFFFFFRSGRKSGQSRVLAAPLQSARARPTLERRRAFADHIVKGDSGHLLTVDLLTFLHPAVRAADLRALAFGSESNLIGAEAITAMCENIVKPVVERVAAEVRAAGDDVNVVLVVDGHSENYAKGATHARRGTSPRALQSTIRAILTKVNQRNDHTLAQHVQSLLKRIPLLSTQSLLVHTSAVLAASSLLENFAYDGQSRSLAKLACASSTRRRLRHLPRRRLRWRARAPG
jgi:hypothetical protein